MYQTLIKPCLNDVKTFILDTLFPVKCLGCAREEKFICPDCMARLKRLEFQHCIVCEKPSPMGFTHPGCLTPHCADGLVSILDYHDKTAADAIIKGKYNFLPGVFEELGSLLAGKLAVDYYHLLSPAPVLVPMPLHKRRLRWRGFNQAEILSQAISQKLNLTMLDALERAKATKTQKDLKREQRIKNVADAFAIKSTVDVHGKNLILIDDVTTTGSTLLEAAKVLKRNGAAKVWCLTVARD